MLRKVRELWRSGEGGAPWHAAGRQDKATIKRSVDGAYPTMYETRPVERTSKMTLHRHNAALSIGPAFEGGVGARLLRHARMEGPPTM